MIQQNERLGTDIADAIRDYADNIRLQRRQMADEEAGKVSVKLLFPVSMFLLPSAVIFMFGPAVLEFFTFVEEELGGTLPGVGQ